MTEDELYEKIVSKYPSYANVPKVELLPKIYEKYPSYRGQINSDSMGSIMAGGVGYGVDQIRNATARSLNKKDTPHIVSKAISGVVMSMPEKILSNPVKFGMSGAPGVAIDPYSNNEDIGFFPKPNSEGGRIMGDTAELVGSAIPISGVSGATKQADRATKLTKRFGQLRKTTKQAQGIADDLIGGTNKARENVGARYQAFIDEFGGKEVDADRMTELLKSAPKNLIDEIKNNPIIEKTVDNYGNTVVKPTLRNMKAIRDIVRGDVSARHWNPKLVDDAGKKYADYAYDEIGQVMRQGNDDLAKIMGEYSDVRRAGDEVYGSLRTSKGFTKTRPVMNLYKDSADGAKQQAFDVLAKYNPEILETMDRARKFGDGYRRGQNLKRYGERTLNYVVPLAAGGYFGSKYFSD